MTIWKAVEHEDLGAIEAYARNGGDLEVGASKLGKTPLLHALILKKKESYVKLLSLGASPNAICRGGSTTPANSAVIHHAALEPDSFWLRAALESRGDPDLMNDGEGMSKGRPLCFAIAGKGRIANVKLLCEHGADVNAPIDHLGLTALHEAAGKNFEIVHYLLERGADVAEPRPVHERNTFIYSIRQKKPKSYVNPEEKKWCAAVWDWLRSHGKDPEKAKWNGSKWTWEPDEQFRR
ncbi:MAG TPA: ankyrin repeat domain-containing protein [Pirellulaceae bacterium]|nr:ankyrin repeat domain-containing protein [Pirellulaceae bacterium]